VFCSRRRHALKCLIYDGYGNSANMGHGVGEVG